MANFLKKFDRSYLALFLIILMAAILFVGRDYFFKPKTVIKTQINEIDQEVVLPVSWQSLGLKMVQAGVVSKDWQTLYANESSAQELVAENNDFITINKRNNGIWLNLLWGLGLGNQNEILEKGPMSDPKYGGAGNFASTGGWTLSQGQSMDHYSKHQFIVLSDNQQLLVEKVSKNIYRPCCDNSTYFPDCNHGMAMLGLLELLAANNVKEEEMYEIAFKVNSFWFPNQYDNISQYLIEQKRTETPKTILGKDFSSASGFQKIAALVKLPGSNTGNKCSI